MRQTTSNNTNNITNAKTRTRVTNQDDEDEDEDEDENTRFTKTSTMRLVSSGGRPPKLRHTAKMRSSRVTTPWLARATCLSSRSR